MTWRLRDADFDLSGWDSLEEVLLAPPGVHGREQERQVSSILRRFVDELFDERWRVTAAAVQRVGAHGADTADTHGPFVENAGHAIPRRAGEQLGAFDEREPLLMNARPGGLRLCGVKSAVCVATEPWVQNLAVHVENAVENSPFGWDNACHSVINPRRWTIAIGCALLNSP